MDIARAVQFVTDDEQWIKKVLIGVVVVLLSIFIIPAFALTGYGIQIARNVKDGNDIPLPEWDDWGKLISDGFAVGIAGFIYAIPAIVLFVIGGVIVGLGDALDSDAILAAGGTVFALLACIAGLYLVAMVVIAPAITIQFIKHGTFASCMRISEVVAIARNNIGDILISLVVIFGISAVLGLVGFIPCLGFLVGIAASPYISMVTSHLYGQIAAKEFGKGSKFDDILINS